MQTLTTWILVFALIVISTPVFSHIAMEAPTGGETLVAESTFSVEWRIVISHSVQNWDLWYSTVSATGPWISISENLPAGSIAAGSIHSYDWTPGLEVVAPSVWVRVRMDNSGTDYEAVSGAFAIEGPAPMGPYFVRGDSNGDGDLNIADSVALLSHLFTGGDLDCLEASDLNDDGELNIADPVFGLSWFFVAGSPAPALPFPGCDVDPLVATVGCEISSCIP